MAISGSEAAKILSSMRRMEEKVCPVCGKCFVSIRKAITCGPSCSLKAYRARNKEAINARRREQRRQQKGSGSELLR